MRAVADYAMKGRRQAIIVVLLSGLIPLVYMVSAAVVGLVNLRRSIEEGLLILLWSLLPAAYHIGIRGDSTPLILMLSVAVMAQVLRYFESWQKVVMAGTVLALLTQFSLIWQSGYMAQIEMAAGELVNAQLRQGSGVELTEEQWISLFVGFYGSFHFAVSILCLAVARWWQSVLYNPGGFRHEFHALRLEKGFAILLAGLILAGLLDIPPVAAWLSIFCIPPLLSGLALMHYMVADRKMGPGWLVAVYLVLFTASPLVILLGLVDSITDLRKRMKTK